jgi:hypothetical protein
MIVTMTEFAQLARDQNGHLIPLGTNRLVCQELTGAGAFQALQGATRFVRLGKRHRPSSVCRRTAITAFFHRVGSSSKRWRAAR